MRLDEDAIRLLEAMHRGCMVRLDDEAGLRWHVEARTVIPMQQHDEEEITLVDLDSDEIHEGTQAGPRRRLDDWSVDEPFLRLGAGILLIRLGLAARKGIALFPTLAGRALAASRIGDGVDIAGRGIELDPGIRAAAYEISAEAIDMAPFQSVEADQRLTILSAPGRRAAILRFASGGRQMDAVIDEGVVASAFDALAKAIEARGRCLVQLSDETRLLKGGRRAMIEIEAIKDFERAIVALRPPHIDAFVEAVKRAIDENVQTVLQPVAVAYGAFDALLQDAPAKTVH